MALGRVARYRNESTNGVHVGMLMTDTSKFDLSTLTDEQREAISKVGYFMQEYIPFNKYIGLEIIAVGPDYALLRLPFKEELVGDPQRRAIHGGVLSSVLDVAGGTVCWAAMMSLGSRVSTVDLRVDYLRKGLCEELHCEAKLVRLGRSVGVARMEVFPVSNREHVIATGQGVYNLVHSVKK